MRVKCGSTQSRTGQDKYKYRYRYRRVTTVLTVQSFTWFISTSSPVESSRVVVQSSPGQGWLVLASGEQPADLAWGE